MSEEFWTFSLQFYRSSGVSEACLELQDRHQADVNLVLFALWAACCGSQLDKAAFAEAERVARPWREAVTQPIRAARRALRDPPDGFDAGAAATLRQQVLAIEIEAERLQQAAMVSGFAGAPGSAPQAAARENLRLYEAFLGKPFGSAPVETLLRAFAARLG